MNLFDIQPKITQVDRKQLSPHLSGWNKLCEFMKRNPSELVIKKLLVIESERKEPRLKMAERLVGRLSMVQRQRILTAFQCLNDKSKQQSSDTQKAVGAKSTSSAAPVTEASVTVSS